MNKTLPFQNQQLFYRIEGSGKPVILVHGFGEDGSIWEPVITGLTNEFSFIIPDLPGSGRSPLIEDMSMEGMAEVIKAIIQQEEIEKCPMIGHSMGGYITLAFADKYQDLLSGIGLFHSSAFADSEEKKQGRKKSIEFINQNGPEAFLKTTLPNLFSQQSRDEKPQLAEELLASGHNFSGAALVNYYESMMKRPDRTDLLRQATVPLLFIIGKFDQAVPPGDSLKQCHLPEKSYIHLLRKSGHMGMLEEPGKSNVALLSFLNDL